MNATMDAVPWLRSGTGKNPADGGCVLQIVDWIDRGQWTDQPPCVHPIFRDVAIRINDEAKDDERQQLLDLIPRLRGTSTEHDWPPYQDKVAIGLAARAVELVLPLAYDYRPRTTIEAVKRWLAEPSNSNAIAVRASRDELLRGATDPGAGFRVRDAAVQTAGCVLGPYRNGGLAEAPTYRAVRAVGVVMDIRALNTVVGLRPSFLVALLDEFDRITGRGEVEPVDLAPVAELMKA